MDPPDRRQVRGERCSSNSILLSIYLPWSAVVQLMLRSREETSSLHALSWAFSLVIRVKVMDMVIVNGYGYCHKL